jgi:hypothetical protein
VLLPLSLPDATIFVPILTALPRRNAKTSLVTCWTHMVQLPAFPIQVFVAWFLIKHREMSALVGDSLSIATALYYSVTKTNRNG